jgi:hypothetical protein
VADWNSYYLNANPGPYFPCIELLGSGYPTFDGDQGSAEAPNVAKMNNSLSVAGQTQNLTPPTAYSCRTGGGQLTWNPTATANATYGPARTLTVAGSIFVDGNLKIETPTTDAYRYSGKATIYARGSIAMKSSKLCGGVSGSDCDFAAWDPNTNMLAFVAYSSGGQQEVDTGNSIHLKSASFQGALYAEHDIQLDTTSKSDGPMVAGEIQLGQSVRTSDFPAITEVPAGMPSNPTVYAQPLPPELYKG